MTGGLRTALMGRPGTEAAMAAGRCLSLDQAVALVLADGAWDGPGAE